MIIYAETSAVLRWLLNHDAGESVREHLSRAKAIFTSRLTLIEIERVISRQLSDGVLAEQQAVACRQLLGGVTPQWHIVQLIEAVSERAAQRFPVEPVRTLDAIHLATMLLIFRFEPSMSVLSTDHRIEENAIQLGLSMVPLREVAGIAPRGAGH